MAPVWKHSCGSGMVQVLEQYMQRLHERGVASADEVADWQHEAAQRFETEYAASRAGDYNVSAAQWLGSTWQGDALQVSLASPLQTLSGKIASRFVCRLRWCDRVLRSKCLPHQRKERRLQTGAQVPPE